MQQVLPIFPEDIKMVNYQVGFKRVYDFVHYFVKHSSLLSLRRKGGYLLFCIQYRYWWTHHSLLWFSRNPPDIFFPWTICGNAS
ncbi:hypothetical protein ES705_47613 [subsurface metagenome]